MTNEIIKTVCIWIALITIMFTFAVSFALVAEMEKDKRERAKRRRYRRVSR